MAGSDEGLCFASARELVAMMVRRELSARELLTAHLAQIERVNTDVNAIVTLVPERAAAAAAAADEHLASGGAPGLLHGLPVAHKDTHRTAGIRTTFGSPIHADLVPEEDDLIVARLREAGVVTIGKTNVPEFAAGSHTFNPLFGATANPYDLSRSAGGSSGGAAAALATGMCPLADGSDMGGSLRNPASFCNVVGMRPSVGRVPGVPAVNAWANLSVEGMLARSADDLALALSAVAGEDPRSPIALPGDGSALGAPLGRSVGRLRVGWSRDLGGAVPVEAEPAAAVAAAALLFEGIGADIEEACPDFSGGDLVFKTLRAQHFALAYGALLDAHRPLVKQTLAENIEAGRALTGEQLRDAEQARTVLYLRFAEYFSHHDLLLLPVSQVPPFPIGAEYPTEISGVALGGYLDWMASCYLVSVTGLPACSVPVAFTEDGLPLGVQVVGPPRDDRLVLEAAHLLERAAGVSTRRPALAVGG
ncbi:MAG TPA: amidase [Acidimicrobiales bacterium]|nr:amidase [Acidimicrobiales bacterium]